MSTILAVIAALVIAFALGQQSGEARAMRTLAQARRLHAVELEAAARRRHPSSVTR